MENDQQPGWEAFLAAYYSASEERKRAAVQAAISILCGHAIPQSEELLTQVKLAEKLSIVASTVWRWGFPHVNWLGAKRYRLSECLAFLNSDAFKLRRQLLREERRRQEKQASRKAAATVPRRKRADQKGTA